MEKAGTARLAASTEIPCIVRTAEREDLPEAQETTRTTWVFLICMDGLLEWIR